MKQKQDELTYEEYSRWRKIHTLKGSEVSEDRITTKRKPRKEGKKETAIEKVLRVARILKENGIDFAKIEITKKVSGKSRFILLEEIEQDGIDVQKIIRENGLDAKFKFGQGVNNLRNAYKSKGTCIITEQNKMEAEELGLVVKEKELTYTEYTKWRETHTLKGSNVPKVYSVKKQKRKREIKETAIAETLKIIRILKANGVDVSKIQLNKSIKGLPRYILLEEIEQDGIDIQKIIMENGLDGKFKYGMRVNNLISAYKGKVSYKITEEEKREVEELGLMLKSKSNRKSAVSETLRIVKILKANGVDVSKIQLHKTVNGEQRCILLGEIEQDGIDIQKIIRENGLDEEFKYGRRVDNLKKAYKGMGKYKITEEEKREAEKLGLITKALIDKEKQKQEAINENEKAKKLLEEYRQLEGQQKWIEK